MKNSQTGQPHKYLVSLFRLIDNTVTDRSEHDDEILHIEDQLAMSEYRKRRNRSVKRSRRARSRDGDSAA